jgi:23S rRNA (pseudouridine1915-N3)-methyltransferase
MKLSLCAVGRLRAGPERALVDDYLDRFAKTGRALGFAPVAEREVEAKGGAGPEGEALLRAVPGGALRVVLDERGAVLTSPAFAARLAAWRDAGREAAFVIGGADGLSPALREGADLVLSFGAMVWPHMLVRVMMAEQLYRASAILAGTPYHRA